MQKNKEQEAQEGQPEEFDLSSINTLDKSNEGIDVDILSPEGEGTGFVIHVLGSDSEAWQKESRILMSPRTKNLTKRRRFRVEASDIEQNAKDSLELLIRSTTRWSLNGAETVNLNGKALKCTHDNVELVYKQYPDIRRQVQAAVDDIANFTKG